MVDFEDPKIRYDVVIKYPDDSRYLTLCIAQLFREYTDWLESVNPLMVDAQGMIELPSGQIKWRRIP